MCRYLACMLENLTEQKLTYPCCYAGYCVPRPPVTPIKVYTSQSFQQIASNLKHFLSSAFPLTPDTFDFGFPSEKKFKRWISISREAMNCKRSLESSILQRGPQEQTIQDQIPAQQRAQLTPHEESALVSLLPLVQWINFSSHFTIPHLKRT